MVASLVVESNVLANLMELAAKNIAGMNPDTMVLIAWILSIDHNVSL